jgi:alanine dehydrogenase
MEQEIEIKRHRNCLIVGQNENPAKDKTMLIGCPKEIKNQEYRVGMTPSATMEAISRGHKVIIETNAGIGAGFPDDDYTAVGAEIVDTAAEVFSRADMVVKVKEPQPVERKQLREGQILFTYLHLAPDAPQTKDLLESGVTAIAYETVTDRNGGLPLPKLSFLAAALLAPTPHASRLEWAQMLQSPTCPHRVCAIWMTYSVGSSKTATLPKTIPLN